MSVKNFYFDVEKTPENALAIKIKEEIIDKLLSVNTKEEIKDVLNKTIAENYESLDIDCLKEINSPLNVVLDSYVACSLQQTADNLTSAQVAVGDLLKNAIELVKNPPAFNLPSPFPIVDTSQDFTKQLLASLLKTMVKILLSIVKKILQLIIDSYSSNANNTFDQQNISLMLAESFGGDTIQATNFINEAFSAFGVDSSGLTIDSINCNNPIDEASIETIKTTSQFIDDLSMVLTPLEICNFFENTPTEQSLQVVQELIKFEHPNLNKVFNSKTKIKQLFKTLSKKIDPKICKTIKENVNKISSNPDICFTQDGAELRRAFLKKRNLSDEQIEDLIEKERDRQKANLQQMANLLANAVNEPNKLFGDQQEIFCKGGQPGLISMEQMPSLKQNMLNTTDYIFNVFATTFIKELNYYQSSYITQQKTANLNNKTIPKFKDLEIVDANGYTRTIEKCLNPDFVKKTSFDNFTLCDDEGNYDSESIQDYYGENINIDKILSISTVQDLEDQLDIDNVYVINYDTKEFLAIDFFFSGSNRESRFGLINSYEDFQSRVVSGDNRFVSDFITTNVVDMSISLNLPTKFVPYGAVTTIPDFYSISSTDNITIYTHGTGSV
jgi:hypothetical protein